MDNLTPHEIHLSVDWPAKYWESSLQNKAEKILLLLHGFQQTGETIFKKLRQIADTSTLVLAPNAPFPIPVRRFLGGKNQWDLAATWYFFNPDTGQYYMDMKNGVSFLTRFLSKLNPQSLPISIIGFSQGGYIAPFIAEKLPNCHHVIGIGSRFRSEDLPGHYAFRLDAIHGQLDTAVDPVRSQKCHQEILDRGNQGSFHLLPQLEHRIDGQVVDLCKTLLARTKQPPDQ